MMLKSSQKPGVLLIHGGDANAQWWSFMAPFLGNDRDVFVIDLPEMGYSGRRDTYSNTLHAEEIYRV